MRAFNIYDNLGERTAYSIKTSETRFNIYNISGTYIEYALLINNGQMLCIYDLEGNYVSYGLINGENSSFLIYNQSAETIAQAVFI